MKEEQFRETRVVILKKTEREQSNMQVILKITSRVKVKQLSHERQFSQKDSSSSKTVFGKGVVMSKERWSSQLENDQVKTE